MSCSCFSSPSWFFNCCNSFLNLAFCSFVSLTFKFDSAWFLADVQSSSSRDAILFLLDCKSLRRSSLLLACDCLLFSKSENFFCVSRSSFSWKLSFCWFFFMAFSNCELVSSISATLFCKCSIVSSKVALHSSRPWIVSWAESSSDSISFLALVVSSNSFRSSCAEYSVLNNKSWSSVVLSSFKAISFSNESFAVSTFNNSFSRSSFSSCKLLFSFSASSFWSRIFW